MAADGTDDVRARLDAWQREGADRLDPLRFQRIAALQRRLARHRGAARQVLAQRLGALIEAYARDLQHARRNPGDTPPPAPAPGPLHGLAGELAQQAAARDAVTTATAPGAGYPQLAALEDFRQLWSRLRTGAQVRQSLAGAPSGAGPLNSSALAHRGLTLMHEASPDYLQRFLAYVDTLSWLQQFQDAGMLAGREAPQAAAGKPRARTPRPRKRRE